MGIHDTQGIDGPAPRDGDDVPLGHHASVDTQRTMWPSPKCSRVRRLRTP